MPSRITFGKLLVIVLTGLVLSFVMLAPDREGLQQRKAVLEFMAVVAGSCLVFTLLALGIHKLPRIERQTMRLCIAILCAVPLWFLLLLAFMVFRD